MARDVEKIKLKCSIYNINKKERKQWSINPITRVIHDRTKYSRKRKHRNKDWSN